MLATKPCQSMQSERTAKVRLKRVLRRAAAQKSQAGHPCFLVTVLAVPIKLESLHVLDMTTIMQCSR